MLAPEERDVEFKFKSADDVATEPSAITVVASDFNQRNHAAVPVAETVALVIAAAVIKPFVCEKAADAGRVIDAKRFCVLIAVSGVEGCAPS